MKKDEIDPSKKKSVTRTTFLKKAGSQTVDIRVGEEMKLFRVHKSLLCTRVPYFNKMFNSGFSESTTNSAVLREDDLEAFDVLVDWVYTSILPPDADLWGLVGVYVLADKICLPELMDQVMDTIQAKYPLHPSDASDIYSILPKGSKLRLLALDMITFEFTKPMNAQLDISKLADVNAKNEEFALDFLIKIRSHMSRQTAIPNPRKSRSCTYHSHEDGKCTRTRK
ncbi:hypothetical protein BGAL_0625g00060 [Botrytis galanthina]|uniref:BTB domain-containing protein n=1 Tax=Botrytis galanthina TaxID=278940 RepID=A0A4S8QJ25_9HELO|nr:hypothetical protein BGAL_0625g00060 [Botrytis galanthina]